MYMRMSLIMYIGMQLACNGHKVDPMHAILYDEDLTLELIDSQPNIVTPIGLTIDAQDHIYVLESHTHSPPQNYEGPAFDLIKKSSALNRDLKPTAWMIFADSIEDGMNIIWHRQILYLVEKN